MSALDQDAMMMADPPRVELVKLGTEAAERAAQMAGPKLEVANKLAQLFRRDRDAPMPSGRDVSAKLAEMFTKLDPLLPTESVFHALPGIDGEPHQQRWLILNAPEAFVNAIRRMLIAFVPTVAIDQVVFQQNDCPVPDAYIAHRLGLIPLIHRPTPPAKELQWRHACACKEATASEYCPQCQVFFSLNVTAPPDASRAITSADLDFRSRGTEPEIEVACTGVAAPIPICKVAAGQTLRVFGTARKGCGREHAKFSPACSAAYGVLPEIRIARPSRMTPEQRKTCVERCPRRVLASNEAGDIEVVDLLECTLCQECTSYARSVGAPGDIRVRQRVTNHGSAHFIFSLETTMAVEPRAALVTALRLLRYRLELLRRQLAPTTSAVGGFADDTIAGGDTIAFF